MTPFALSALKYGLFALLFLFVWRSMRWAVRGLTVEPSPSARKARKSYCFSKDWSVHQAITFFTMYSYNFCWPVRTLRIQDEAGRWRRRTPAMAAGLADHVWSLSEWLSLPAVHRN